MTHHSKGSFQVLGGEVCSGIDPTVVLLETADRQWDLLRVDQLDDNWFALGVDGVTRVLTRPTRQHRHQRKALQRLRSPLIRAKRTVLTLYGTP